MLFKFRYAKHGPGCYPLDLLWPMAPCSAKCGGCTDLPRNKSRIRRYVLRWFSLFRPSLPRPLQPFNCPSSRLLPAPTILVPLSYRSIPFTQFKFFAVVPTVISAGCEHLFGVCGSPPRRRVFCYFGPKSLAPSHGRHSDEKKNWSNARRTCIGWAWRKIN